MTPDWPRVRELFELASKEPADRRWAFLAEACAGDRALFDEVASLLEASTEDDDDLTPPGADAVRSLIGAAPGQLAEGTTIGGFRLVRVLGAGGMGVVYEAEQESPSRRVALKVMRFGLDTDRAAQRFRHEAEVLAGLRHPGIATIHETGVHVVGDREVPWFAMEYVEGARTIVEHAEEAALSVEARLRLFVAVCEAVHHGHVKGVIHRDLKPENILVDADGRPRVIDFGVALATDADLALSTFQTQEGAVLGTLSTMSPEQIAGKRGDLDLRSDVYSLGVVLYRLLTGRYPHEIAELSLPEAARVIRDDPPTRAGVHDTRLRGDLETILLEALEKEPSRRYSSAAALGDDVERFLAGEPIRARPPSIAYQARLFTRRHRALVGALLAVAVVSLVGAGVSLRYALRAERAAGDATRRYGIVRDVGRDLLYDVLDEMDGLAGGSQARARVGETALTYLEALELEAGDDADVLHDLFVGYHRVGMLLGDTRRASLGLNSEAVRSLERALGVEERIRALEPDRPGLARTSLRLRLDLGRLLEELGRTEEARVLFEEVLGAAAASGVHDLVGSALLQLGDRARDHGDAEEASAFYERAREAWAASTGPGSLDLALVLDRLGSIALDAGDVENAVSSFRDGLALVRQLAEQSPSDLDVRAQEVWALGNLAAAAERRGELEQSRDYAVQSVAAAEVLVGEDPKNSYSRLELAWALEQRGVAERLLGELVEARASFARAADLLDRNLALEPSNLHLRSRAAELRAKESVALRQSGEGEGALSVVRAAVQELEAVLRAEPGVVDRDRALCFSLSVLLDTLLELDRLAEAVPVVERFSEASRSLAARSAGNAIDQRRLLLAYDRVGMIQQRRAADDALSPEERLSCHARAAEAYRDCLTVFDSLREQGFLYHGDEEAARYVENELAACEEARDRMESELSR